MNETIEQKQARIVAKIEAFEKELQAETYVKFFVGVVDRDPRDITGGKAFTVGDFAGIDMQIFLDVALPSNKDLTNLGIWVGQILGARNKVRIKAGNVTKPKLKRVK